jgi:hypothetical protein
MDAEVMVMDPQMTQAAIALGVVLMLLVVGGFILFSAIGLMWYLLRRRKRRMEERGERPQPLLQPVQASLPRDAATIYGVRQQSMDDRYKLTDYQLQLIANRANELHRADQEVALDKLLVNLTRPTP